MKNLSKLALAFAMFMGGIFTQTVDAAPQTVFGSYTSVVQPNCTVRREYNDFTKQYTNNEVCNPRVTDVPAGSSVASGGSTGSYYAPASYYSPTSYTPNVNAIQYYSGSNLWNTPSNNYGYLSDSMFNTYYNGGPGDVTGYYDYWGNKTGNDIDYTNGYSTYGNYDETEGLYGNGNNSYNYGPQDDADDLMDSYGGIRNSPYDSGYDVLNNPYASE